jgi:hypothetical protein
MAQPPQWLDRIFEQGRGDAGRIADAILAHAQFAAAVRRSVEDALREYAAAEVRFRDNPGLVDPTPAQAARIEFCRVLGGQVGIVET